VEDGEIDVKFDHGSGGLLVEVSQEDHPLTAYPGGPFTFNPCSNPDPFPAEHFVLGDAEDLRHIRVRAIRRELRLISSPTAVSLDRLAYGIEGAQVLPHICKGSLLERRLAIRDGERVITIEFEDGKGVPAPAQRAEGEWRTCPRLVGLAGTWTSR
jgi:hypothetical protein